MLAAQQAPMGAKICTTSAIRTIGRKFFSRLRIANPSGSELIILRVRSRGQVPGLFAGVAKLARQSRCIPAIRIFRPYHITQLRVPLPTLVLNATNDPFVPGPSLPGPSDVSPAVTLEQPSTGGHVGFVGGGFPGSLEGFTTRLLNFLGKQGTI